MTPHIVGRKLPVLSRGDPIDGRGDPIRLFLSRWFCNPLRTGSVVPSGRPLAEALARQIEGCGEGVVVELGAGTGVVTEALIDSGVQPGRMLVVELDGHMAEHLRRRFPGISVVERDASRLKEIAHEAGAARVAAVVSSLPFLLMSARQQCLILKTAFRLMANEGPFVQFTYGPLSPVSWPVVRRLNLSASRTDHVWLNLPPASIWRYRLIKEPGTRPEKAAADDPGSNTGPRVHALGGGCTKCNPDGFSKQAR